MAITSLERLDGELLDGLSSVQWAEGLLAEPSQRQGRHRFEESIGPSFGGSS